MKNTQHFKEILETEKKNLEAQLKIPENPTDTDHDRADETEVADSLEILEENASVDAQLEARLAEVHAALEKLNAGTYGICEVGGEEIEEDRLEANPAASTCKAHME